MALAWLWWRGRKDPGYRANLDQRLGKIEPAPASIHGLLIHAASVGEVQAAQPLIAALRTTWPDHAITVTTQTPTGARALRKHWGDALQHLFFPVDTTSATTRFLDRLQPRLVVVIEREVWPEWLLQCQARAIPVALVNARLTERSARSYLRARGLMTPAWRSLALVAAADADSAKRLIGLGVTSGRTVVTGNLKFDQPGHPSGANNPLPHTNRPMVVAGSTHEGEESALLDAWPTLLLQHPDALLVIVPRHPERFDEVAKQVEGRGFAFARRSRNETPDSDTSIWLGDTMGELGHWYARSSLCFIGGTLIPIGGHNPLEALAVGKPVLFGPHTQNAAEVYGALARTEAGRPVASADEAILRASEWLSQPDALHTRGQAALAFVAAQQGSSASTLDALTELWVPLDPHQLHAVIEHKDGGTTTWHNPLLLDDARASHAFDPPGRDAVSLATGSGRGQAQQLKLNGHEVVLRHYRRGGMVARFNPDRYAGSAPRDSRAMREFSLLRWMKARGLPVPAPVAARQQSVGKNYTADIIVGMLPNSRNLVQRLAEATLSDAHWLAVGTAIRTLHDAQVFHSDLNAHNLLLDSDGQAWIVDFDKCDVRSGGDWKAANLERLKRSLRKERDRLPRFHWSEADWNLLQAAYTGKSPLP
ncbi:3-deoxy-D-manno-octulosonic acid kinase [Hydrogenophaga crassostreae]|nr:3-deoxy-D-manno-octulosonic acid kinase [Hydrogenophaga crassostreae]